MNIVIGSDHAGFIRKAEIIDHVKKLGHEITDIGTFSANSVDYPDYAYNAAILVSEKKYEFGILVCGSGIGVSITANKVEGIRAANCLTVEMAHLARQHNNANILTIGERLIDTPTTLLIIDEFLQTPFEGGRHAQRVEKIHTQTGR